MSTIEFDERLPDKLHQRITELSEAGNELVDESRYEMAINVFKQAFDLLLEPKDRWEAATWLLVAIGDCFYFQNNFQEAYSYFRTAQKYPGGLENPYIFIRIGECLCELGTDESEAADSLMRAYMLAGAEIFESEDSKYMKF